MVSFDLAKASNDLAAADIDGGKDVNTVKRWVERGPSNARQTLCSDNWSISWACSSAFLHLAGLISYPGMNVGSVFGGQVNYRYIC